jgi:hypothetical protein
MTFPDEAELRAIVREVIAGVTRSDVNPPVPESWRAHASHVQLRLTRGDDGDGACLVEPAVRCTHCGYCRSFGH